LSQSKRVGIAVPPDQFGTSIVIRSKFGLGIGKACDLQFASLTRGKGASITLDQKTECH
jgi:hypothetical protein